MNVEDEARRNTFILVGFILTVVVTAAYWLGQMARGF